MKDEKLVEEFEPMKIEDIVTLEYKEYKITGGEPLLALGKVLALASGIKNHSPDSKIYVYTNGLLLTEEIAKELETNGVTALTVSPHQYLNRATLIKIHAILPILISIGDIENISDWPVFCDINDMLLNIWQEGYCYKMPPEGRYYAK